LRLGGSLFRLSLQQDVSACPSSSMLAVSAPSSLAIAEFDDSAVTAISPRISRDGFENLGAMAS
jgi:hypothetical protein